MQATVLFLDDEPNVLAGLSRAFRREPYEILTARSAVEAAGILLEQKINLIVTDEEMPGMSGTEFLAGVARDFPDIVGIVLTGRPTLPAALRAINEGHVRQFFTKPCNEIELALAIRTALEEQAALQAARHTAEADAETPLLDEARTLQRLREPDPG